MSKESKRYKAPNRETWVKGKLRQASLRWPPRGQALRCARKDRGLYACAMCHQLFKSSAVHLDHINPVVSVREGFIDWNEFILRLFPDVEGWQVLCKNCHDAKTKVEDMMRTHFNRAKKVEKAKGKR